MRFTFRHFVFNKIKMLLLRVLSSELTLLIQWLEGISLESFRLDYLNLCSLDTCQHYAIIAR